MDTLVDYIKESLFNQNNFKLSLDYSQKQLLSSIIYYMLFSNMTFDEFKNKYDKTINYHKDNKYYSIEKDLIEIYKEIVGKNPDKKINPVPKNSYIDTVAQIEQQPYNVIAKKEGLLY